ncbi:MAG: SpoIIE family protein phosphatase [Actinomycetota bacterium]|nr:SpoIIE family protein phosphatase [Actinomycetota bacterium]
MERLEYIFETLVDGIIIMDRNGYIKFANKGTEKILGLKRSEIIGRTCNELPCKITTLGGEPLSSEMLPFSQAIRTGKPVFDRELSIERVDDSRAIISVNAAPFTDESGDITGIVISLRDISERKQAEEALKKSEKQLRDITSVLGEGVYVLDKDGHLTFMNPAAESLLRWIEAELYGKDVHEAIHYQRADGARFRAEECPVLEIISSGGVYRTDDDVFTRKDGSIFPVAYVTTPIIENGQVVASVTTFQDITERKRAERLRDALNDINAAVNSTLEFDEIMKRVVVEACEAIVCETTAITMREDDYWVVRYAHGFAREIIGVKLTDEEAPHLTLAARTNKPIAIDHAYSDERVDREVMAKYDISSTLVVPLMVKENVMGVLSFNHHSAAVAFKEVDVDFASKLGLSLSLAIENARLYAGQRRIADTLQEALLTMPERIEGIDFGYLYLATTDTSRVGGDFYDVIELDHDRVGLVVGDVSGHGLEAATLTALVKSTIRAYAYDNSSPAIIMAKTNEAIIKASAPELFITVFFGTLDTKSGVLTYCSAGHPPAIVKRKTSKAFFLTTNSPAIGAFRGLTYLDNQETLKKGDALIIYTDGVIEARCDNEFFGDERLIKLIDGLKPTSAKEIPQAIFNEVADCTGGILSDDVAILAVRLEGD